MTTKVLVVDDESDTLNLLRTLLEITGFNPVTTLNSMEAITLAEIENVDVALLDIMMPNINGFELCIQMRKHDKLKQLPIIFVTAYDALDLEDRRKAAGADYVVRKPIDIDQLTNVINSLYEKRQAGALPVPTISPSTAELLAAKHEASKKAGNSTRATTESKPVVADTKTVESKEAKKVSPAEAGASSTEQKTEASTKSDAEQNTSKKQSDVKQKEQADRADEKQQPKDGASTSSVEDKETKTDNSSTSNNDAAKRGPIKPKRPPTPS